MTLRSILTAALCLFFLVAGTAPTGAQTPSEAPAPEAVIDLKTSLTDALKTAEAQRDRLKAELEGFRRENRALAGELAAYRIQLSTYGNLAALPSVTPEVLAEAIDQQRRSRTGIQETLDRLVPRREALAEMSRQTEQQLALNRTQLEALKKMPPSATEEGRWLDQIAALIRVQKDALSLIGKLDPLYAEAISGFETMASDLAGLEPTLATARDAARRTAVFTRGENPISKLHPTGVAAEARRLAGFAQSLGEADFWRRQFAPLLDQGWGPILTALVLCLGLLLALIRFRIGLGRMAARIDETRYPWRAGLLAMVQRTVVPLGLLLFFTLNSAVRLEPDARTLTGILVAFFWAWLPGRWLRCFFTMPLPALLTPQWPLLAVAARRLVRLSRLYAAAHLFLAWSIGPSSMMEAVARMALEAALVATTVVFWRQWRKSGAAKEPVESRNWRLQAAVGFSYFWVLAGPILDLAGYGALALYWYAGWGLTLVAVLWAGLLGQTLREIDLPPAGTPAEAPPARPPLHWALVRLAWLVWGAVFLASLVLAWGGWRSLSQGAGQVLNHPFVIGDATFRLSGVLIGLLVLFFTHLATRLWRQVLTGRILASSGMTHGARDSVVTISVYLIWAVGILIALHAFGISTTSLMVAFGALGIGLGFGLQNIFNNFISGLILLFERPIQVGDDIEINGVWAKVMQINVRATVVQTYDNAALIIPNSEFISNAVTNWSHRDPYLRRHINVGVAYGSDTELVRQTLLEAAANTAEVLAHPKPDVLFTDFGESTLNFRLRVWTTVNSMVPADTALRFEIDRLFRQRQIEMAFPQRDLHVRTLPSGFTPDRVVPPSPPSGNPEVGDDPS